jgi:hypothetical protein
MRSILFAALFLGVLGCSSAPVGPAETVVTGEVFLDGTKLTMGIVYLENEGATQSGQGEIAPDGTFRVPSSPLGAVKAAVRTSGHARFASSGKKTIGGKTVTIGEREGTFIAVPAKYEDTKTSELSYTIAKDAKLKIELTSK